MEESWIKQYWRPAIAWQYFAVCLFDFIVFPCLAAWFSYTTKIPFLWEPITLKQSGFYHMAMAAIIGVTAYTRGQEKIQKLITGEEIIEKENFSQTTVGK